MRGCSRWTPDASRRIVQDRAFHGELLRGVLNRLGRVLRGILLVERLRVGENVVRALADIRRGCHDGFLGAQRRRGRESVDLPSRRGW